MVSNSLLKETLKIRIFEEISYYKILKDKLICWKMF